MPQYTHRKLHLDRSQDGPESREQLCQLKGRVTGPLTSDAGMGQQEPLHLQGADLIAATLDDVHRGAAADPVAAILEHCRVTWEEAWVSRLGVALCLGASTSLWNKLASATWTAGALRDAHTDASATTSHRDHCGKQPTASQDHGGRRYNPQGLPGFQPQKGLAWASGQTLPDRAWATRGVAWGIWQEEGPPPAMLSVGASHPGKGTGHMPTGASREQGEQG